MNILIWFNSQSKREWFIVKCVCVCVCSPGVAAAGNTAASPAWPHTAWWSIPTPPWCCSLRYLQKRWSCSVFVLVLQKTVWTNIHTGEFMCCDINKQLICCHKNQKIEVVKTTTGCSIVTVSFRKIIRRRSCCFDIWKSLRGKCVAVVLLLLCYSLKMEKSMASAAKIPARPWPLMNRVL